MSGNFRVIETDVSMCNRALSLLGQAPISQLEPALPQGAASRECARWYRPIVAGMLEKHHWNLATNRTVLTELVNDRSPEWLYRYQLPPRVAFPVALTTFGVGSDISYYQGLGGLIAQVHGSPAFLMTGRVLYTRYNGELDFVSFDITEADFNDTFKNIVVLALAAAMAFALTKSTKRETDLREQLATAMNLAITQNLNVGKPTYGNFISERDVARGMDGAGSVPWDWRPGNI